MSETIFSEAIRDTAEYSDTNDSGAIAGSQLFHIVNTTDVNITVTFYGTRQENSDSFSESVTLGSVLVSSNNTDYETLSDPWEEIQVTVVANTAPSEGFVDIYEMN